MALEWMVPFQEAITAMHQQVQALLLYPIVGEAEHHMAETLRGLVDYALQWSQALVSDEAVWAWINTSETFDPDVTSLSSIALICDVLIVHIETRSGVDDPLLPRINAMGDEARHASAYLQGHIQGQAAPWISPASPLQALSPAAILAILQAPNEAEIKISSQIPDISSWPAAVYHPHYTTGLLHRLILSLNRSRFDPVQLSLARTPHGLNLMFTRQEIWMTPVLWQGLLARLRSIDDEQSLEFLREMGGEIEPLTWNEGQGEGVIVRLPWAKT